MTANDLRLVMMGTGTFAEPAFQGLLQAKLNVVGLVTQPDRATGGKRSSTRQIGAGMKNIAVDNGIPVYQPDSINTPEGVAKLNEWQPDLLVVAAYGQILNNEVLAASSRGGINIHASLLPKYRGAAPLAWAIWKGEKETGVTVIKMSVHLDAGDMLAKEIVSIQPDDTAGELESRLAPVGASLALSVIDQIANGTEKGEKQDPAQVTKAPKLKKEMGLIDWNQPAETVCNQIRAMQPWPTPYTFLHVDGKPPLRVIISRAKRLQDSDNRLSHNPGDVVFHDRSDMQLLVAASGNTMVEILEIQPAGKRRMSAEEFLRGHRLPPGFFGAEQL